MNERAELEQAIQQLEAQRDILGNAAIDAALAGIHQRLAALDELDLGKDAKPSPADHMGERRVVTVLFCDVVGSTTLAEGMDPEAWTDIMNTTFEHLIQPVERYGGTVARLMGDAILAFFGAPTAHEDDPQRAILAGLEIVENIAPFRKELQIEKGLDFNVRVGINTGLVVVGDVGSEVAGEYTAMGDAVNVAARMEQTASPGTVQIARDTYALVAPLFEFKELGGILVKGKSEPIPAYQVLGGKQEPGSLRGLSEQGISSPLVGRGTEFDNARQALDRLATGQGGVLAILGEAGIGKSRLISELQKITLHAAPSDVQPDLAPPKIRWLQAQSLSYSQTISYWPFQQILRQFAGIGEDERESIAFGKLNDVIQPLFPAEKADILPYLASLLAIDVGSEYTERLAYLDGEALGRQVYRATRRFFERLAENSPLVLVFDDLHWMDASSVGLLEHLFPLVEQAPLLICGLSRPDQNAPATRLLAIAEEQYQDNLYVIELDPLTAEGSNQLVKNLLEIDDIPEQTRQMIMEKADGNPFYVEEIVRALIDNGALVRESSSGRWRATKRITTVTVPDTIQGLLNARIDRLDEKVKQVIRRAAVIGRSFLYRVLHAVLEDERDLPHHLDSLQRVELIQEQQRSPELEYIFKHALAQEAAYDSILLQERRVLHTQVAEAIEDLMVDRLDEFYGLLAYHYSTAELWEKAQEYLFKAGDQAGSMAADAEALAHYQQAVEAYARVRGDDWEPIDRARLERKIGEALYRLGDFNQARAYLEKSLALLGNNLPASRWRVRLAIVQALIIQASHRLVPGWFIGPIDEVPDPAAEEMYKTSLALGWIEGVSDVERLLLLSVGILNVCERSGFAFGSAYLASSMATAFDLIGWHNQADRYSQLAEQYAQNVVPKRPIFQLEWNRALHYNIHGDFDRSLEHARSAVDIAKSTGDLRSWGTAMDMTSWSHLTQSRLGEALETCQEMIEVAEEGSDLQIICWGLMGLGVTRKRLGQIGQAIKDLERAIEIAQKVPDFHTQVAASAWLGRCLVAEGKFQEAIMILEASQEILQNQSIIIEISILGNGLSEAYLASAESSSGGERQEWIKKAKRSCRDTLKAAKRYRPPLIDAQMLQGRCEWLRGKPAAAERWWEKALAESRDMRDRYAEGMVNLEIGRRSGDPKHLQQAESILEEIGAELDLAAAREALANLGGI